MIDYTYADLFNKDNVKKDLILDFGDFQITNDRLYSESFELSESLCSQNELRFGCCEASVLKFKCRNEFGELKDKWFDASMVLDGKTDAPFQIGSYRVFSDEPSGDRKYKNITAYDAMYGVINAEMVDWYDSLTFPITQKAFRDSFFMYLGLGQVETELVNDDMLIEKTIDADSISGKQIITAICELNGVFGHINRQGLFDYISLEKKKQVIHPGMGTYPGSGIYPGMTFDTDYQKEEINTYISCEYEDFETQLISKLQIRQEEGDVGAIVGTGTNTYIVQDDFLVYGKSTNDLRSIANKLFTRINGVFYRPFKASLRGNPCIEVGDNVCIKAKYKDIEGYVLERTIKGIQALRDTFESKGVYEYAEKVNSVQKEVRRLKGKTNKLERTVEMLNSEINDEEAGLKSQIKQTAEKVEAKVSKGDVSSQLSIELGKILLRGNRIAIESDYFNLTEDGKLHAIDGVFEGDIITKNAIINGGMITIRDEDNPNIFLIKLRRTDENGNTNYVYINSSSLLNVYNSVYTKIGPDGIDVGSISGDPDNATWSETPEASIGQSWSFLNSLRIRTELAVDGTKKRIVNTKNYNERSLYCYEMPSPIFGDVGHGVIGSDGLCYVDIEQIFFETVDMNQSYQVFLQSYAESNVYVIGRQPEYFVVKGEPNTEFDWELKAKQLDFPIHRLEENFAEDDYEETDYVALASEYLNKYEQEVLNYE